MPDTPTSPDPTGGPPPAPLRVAVIQAEPVPGDVAGNAAAAARLAAAAARGGARLAVLPELFLPAYHPPTLRTDPGVDVRADPGGAVADARLDPLRAVARNLGVVVVVGASVRRPAPVGDAVRWAATADGADSPRTCAVLIVDDAGRVTAGYDKQHLWGEQERALFVPGSHGATLVLDGWHLGLGVCYDGCFPEHARAAALAGAHAYLCPSGYVVGSAHRRDLYYAARALDNTMYVVFANSVGGSGEWRFNGGAAVYEPEGRPLCRAPDTGEAVLFADLDPVALVRTRDEHHMLRDRVDALGSRRWLDIRRISSGAEGGTA